MIKKKFRNNNGKQLFPETHVSAVIDNSGKSIEQFLPNAIIKINPLERKAEVLKGDCGEIIKKIRANKPVFIYLISQINVNEFTINYQVYLVEHITCNEDNIVIYNNKGDQESVFWSLDTISLIQEANTDLH